MCLEEDWRTERRRLLRRPFLEAEALLEEAVAVGVECTKPSALFQAVKEGEATILGSVSGLSAVVAAAVEVEGMLWRRREKYAGEGCSGRGG